MNRRTAFITGATQGVGRVVAERLGAMGWHVLVHGRDAERGRDLVETIVSRGGTARFFQADLSSLAEVRSLARALAAQAPQLHLLVNNAGVGFGPPGETRKTSADGFELRFAVNYLAPFMLTRMLLPNLVSAAPARVVNVASIGQRDVDFDDLQFERGYSGVDAYRRSKLALIMFTADLAAELAPSGVTVNAVHPASYMDTAMVRETGGEPQSTVGEGADAIMNLAVLPAGGDRSGAYFDRLAPGNARAQADDKQAQQTLRRMTLELVGALT
jgi:NAD(P)-dependent dehydrogenase (short-subunit alcohol dehydrogenase family)